MKEITINNQAVVLTAKYANGAEWVQRAFQEVRPIINLAFNETPHKYGFDERQLDKIQFAVGFQSRRNRTKNPLTCEVVLNASPNTHQVSIGIDITKEQDALASMLTGIARVGFGYMYLAKMAVKQGFKYTSTTELDKKYSQFEFHGVKIKNYRWFLRWFGLDVSDPVRPRATDNFTQEYLNLIEELGEFPHQAVKLKSKKLANDNSRAMLSGKCTECDARCSVLRGQLDRFGSPLCPVHNTPYHFPRYEKYYL